MGVPGYSVYTALMTQTGTSAPTSTVLQTNFGTVTWVRTSIGFYKLSGLTGATSINTITNFSNMDGSASSFMVISDGTKTSGYYTIYIGANDELWVKIYNTSWVATDLVTLATTTGLHIDIKVFL